MSMLSLQDALLVCEREACIVCILKDPPWGLQSGVELRQRRLTIVASTCYSVFRLLFFTSCLFRQYESTEFSIVTQSFLFSMAKRTEKQTYARKV